MSEMLSRQLPRGPVHNTMLTTAKRCPQKYVYRYVRGIRQIETSLPLRRGLWIHSMLQADALKRGLEHGSLLVVPEMINVAGVGEVQIYAPSGEDPLLMVTYEDETDEGEAHTATATFPLSSGGMLKLLKRFAYDWIPEESKEALTEGGLDLPEACKRILAGYFWRYRDTLDKERPLLVEYENSTDIDGELYHWRIDLLLQTSDGVVTLRDWKSTKSLPTGHAWKLMESQLHLYPVALQPHLDRLSKENPVTDMDGKTKLPNLQVEAVEFDYLRTKPPATPKINQSGKLSRAVQETDAFTFMRAAKEAGIGLDDEVYDTNKTHPVSPTLAEKLEELKHNDIFFARERLPRSKRVTARLLEENASTVALIEALHEDPEEYAYRVTQRMGPESCEHGCEFTDICLGELYGMNMSTVLEREFEAWEPDDLHELEDWQLENGIED